MEHKQNSGSLFRNDYKKEDKHPDYKGKVNIDGKLYDLAAWLRKTDSGKQYMSLKFSEPYNAEPNIQPNDVTFSGGEVVQEDLPF